MKGNCPLLYQCNLPHTFTNRDELAEHLSRFHAILHDDSQDTRGCNMCRHLDMVFPDAPHQPESWKKQDQECLYAMMKVGEAFGLKPETIMGPTAFRQRLEPVEGRKDDDGKLRYDLIPGYALERLAEVYTIGASKYTDHNWRKGMRWGRLFAALMRHAWAWWGGEQLDRVDGQRHLASIAWIAFTLMDFEKYNLGTDDRWRYKDNVVSS